MACLSAEQLVEEEQMRLLGKARANYADDGFDFVEVVALAFEQAVGAATHTAFAKFRDDFIRAESLADHSPVIICIHGRAVDARS
jgi:hypothetical protein